MVDVMFDIGIGTLHGGPFMVPTSILEVNEDQLDGRMPKVPEHFYRAEPSVKPEPVSKDVVNDGIVN
jgi:hypothetical protein